ncbi:aldo/keto reductase family protein [Sulfurimonas sp.]|uniref:aldo/keto reductase family protein n=1 Tax=Sulfurimonas sp. TaxID=2022749 RepID=UPI003D1393A2
MKNINPINMPKILYGTAWKKEKTTELVAKALRTGFRGIDTACQPRHYNEAGVGEALKILAAEGLQREELFIQTKFTPIAGQDPENIPYNPNAPLDEQVFQSFERSQLNLHTSYVNSYVLHSPLFPFSHLLQVWRAMEAIALTGNAQRLGISNCYDLSTLKRLFEEAEVKPNVLQNRFYSDTGYDVELRKFCDENNIQYQSFWSLTANPHILNSKAVIDAAFSHKVDTPQIFYAYLLAKNIVPLDGTTSQIHMQDDLKVLQLSLSKQEIFSIDQLFHTSI